MDALTDDQVGVGTWPGIAASVLAGTMGLHPKPGAEQDRYRHREV